MELIEAIAARHSVRSYIPRPLSESAVRQLEALINEYNAEADLHIQLVKNEPKAFDSRLARYGSFSGVTNYFALVGKKSPDLEEKCGYYGEKLVLEAQRMGLNTCWVALTFKKIPNAFEVRNGEKFVMVIAVGYGTSQGRGRKSKSAEAVAPGYADAPDWFKKGVDAALLAPTAVNQQQFIITEEGDKVRAKARFGVHNKCDLGIVKCHFEIGAGKDRSIWA